MFEGFARTLFKIAAVLGVLWILARIKVLVLVLSWITIVLCLWIIWVKRYSRNARLNARLDAVFLRIRRSRFHGFVVGLQKKMERRRRGND